MKNKNSKKTDVTLTDVPTTTQTQTIVEKYNDLYQAAKKGNIEGKWNIDGIFEIKRYIEKRDGRSYPIDWYCDACLISLIIKLK